MNDSDAWEHLRRTQAALNVALYWAGVESLDDLTHDELMMRWQELAGCREALQLVQEALKSSGPPADTGTSSTTTN